MKLTQWKFALCAGGVLATAFAGTAGPLQRSDVAAEPAWVIHLDVDALRPTAVGRFILAEMEKPEAEARLSAFQAIFNVDVRRQLHGITLYGQSKAPEDGVALVYADFDANRLTTLAKAAHDHQSTDYKKHVIHNWIDDQKKAKSGGQPRTYAAIHGARVVFGQKEERVAQALDVLDQAAPALSAGKALPQLGAAGDASFLQAAVVKLDLPEKDPNATLFRLSKLVALNVGEAQGQVKANLVLEAKDEAVAGPLASIAQGLLALGKLQADKPEAAKFAEAVKLTQDGPRVTASLSLPGDTVVEIMKAGAARKAAKKEPAKS